MAKKRVFTAFMNGKWCYFQTMAELRLAEKAYYATLKTSIIAKEGK